MTTFGEFSITVDHSEVTEATAALDAFVVAAEKARTALDRLLPHGPMNIKLRGEVFDAAQVRILMDKIGRKDDGRA